MAPETGPLWDIQLSARENRPLFHVTIRLIVVHHGNKKQEMVIQLRILTVKDPKEYYVAPLMMKYQLCVF